MTKQEYIEFHKKMCEKLVEITEKKNADYSLFDDPFYNFRLCETVGVASTMQGFLTRMLDKISRINSFAHKGKLEVKEETVHDSLLDLANYCILLSGFITSEMDKNLPEWGDDLSDWNIKVEEKKYG